MKIFESINDVSSVIDGSVLVIGNFDGVHCGHQALLTKGKEIAQKASLPFIVLTFMPHPAEILRPQYPLKLILPYEDKIKELRKYNIDYLIIQKFDKLFSLIQAETFIEDFLINRLRIKHIIVGQNFKFGSNNGNVELLQNYSRKFNFEFLSMDLLYGVDQQIISSSRIKQKLGAGDVHQVKKMLGRDYIVTAYGVESIDNVYSFFFNQPLALKLGLYEVLLRHPAMDERIKITLFYDGFKGGKSQIMEDIDYSEVEITFKNYIEV
jgi:riboflavin kinase/FMN adenylyltransferase